MEPENINAAGGNDNKKKLHIAMFPWLAFGHMIPFFKLSNLLASKGHQISFLSTPRNIHRLPEIPPNLSPFLGFVPLQLPQIPGLPPLAESTADLPTPTLEPYLKLAYDGLEPGVTRFLETNRPDWVVYDFAPHWLPSIAAAAGVSRALFTVQSAVTYVFLSVSGSGRTKPEDFTVPPEWVPFPTTVAFRLHEARRLFSGPPGKAIVPGLANDLERSQATVNGCDVVALRTCPELEPDWLALVGELCGKPFAGVGLIPPPAADEEEDEGPVAVAVGDWLSKQDKGSVVYVACGSEVTLTKEELTELALGLELSGVPFLWVLRKGHGGSSTDDLPEGFLERIQAKGTGMIETSWVPQVKILSHRSVGGFLTHCGWGSLIEALHTGLPLIMLPIHVIDQGLVARAFAEKRLGIEISRNEEDGFYSRTSVAESVRTVMVEESGLRYKARAEEMRLKLFGNTEIHDRCVEEIALLLQDCRKASRTENV